MAAVSLAAAACSSGGTADDTGGADTTGPSIIEATPTPVSEAGAELELAELPDADEGVLVNRFDLDPGDCFNTSAVTDLTADAQPVTRVVDCARAHESEVYLQRNFPAAADEPFPGDEELQRWAEERCYNDFEDFTGREYELSDLEIGVVHPTFTTWTGPGLHREITCFVYAVAGGGLQGSMAGSGF